MSKESITFRDRFLFGLNGFPDQMTYQIFQGLIFTYYFAVIGLELWLMWLAYIIWGIWNAINDPFLGSLSDRKKYGKLGKRKFFIVISFIPLCLMMILLFTVPPGIEFFYFLLIIILFELVYTLFDVNVKSLFPEMWPDEKERAKTNLILRGLTIIAILFAFIFPSFVIPQIAPGELTPEEITPIKFSYIITGCLVAIIVAITGLLFILFGIKEKEEVQEKFEKRPSFFESLKLSLKNKTFVKLVLANMSTWYVLTMLPAMYPLYCRHVLGIEAFLYVGMSLTLCFIVAALVMPVHRKIGFKFGMRKGFMITMIILIGTLIPYLFFSDNDISRILGIIATASVGFGISGIMFYFDILIGDVIDQDELKTGVKRSASFYGTNAFIHRFSIIFFISTVAIVFSGTAWAGGYVPTGTIDVITGLKLLLFLFPAISCVIAFLFMNSYDLHGEKLANMRQELQGKIS